MLPVTLRTARLELSVPGAADAGAIHAAVQDPDIPRFTTIPAPYTRADAEEFVARCATDWTEGTHLRWALRHEGRLLGVIGLHGLNGSGVAEIGYWTAASARGAGYTREATAAVIEWAFSPDAPELVRLEWRASVGNVGSARIARAVGFRFEGTLRTALRNGFGERSDGWVAGLLARDHRTPQEWPVDL